MFSSKIFLIIGIGIVLFIIIAIIGAVLGSNKGGEKNLSFRLKLHLSNTSELVNTFQPSIKSSDLRSGSASLYSVLTNTDRELTDYLTERYGFKDKDISSKITEEMKLERDGLETKLFEAKISGTLDRVFANEMSFEVSTLMNEESKIYDTTGNTDLKELLTKSYNSLENLYNKFDSFSEAN